MTTAWALTHGDNAGKYEVTVYTDDHLLGGKAANTRGENDRIEEHGLHMMLGWYENVFSVVRAAYTARQPAPDNPFQSWEDAFVPQRTVSLGDLAHRATEPKWETWTVRLPRRPGKPGDGRGLTGDHDFLTAMVAWLDSVLRSALKARKRLWRKDERAVVKKARRQARRKGRVRPRIFHAALDRIQLLWSERDAAAPPDVFNNMLELLQEFAEWLDHDLHLAEDNLRRAVRLLQLGVVVVRGYLKDIVRPRAAFNSLNHLEFRDWLKKHGAGPELRWWAPIRALYTLGFAYEDGEHTDPDRGRIAAGVGLRILLKLGLDYKDAPLWRMRAGMGDCILAPMYEVLSARGVQFRFFHRVHRLRTRGRRIDAVELVARDWSGPVLMTVRGLPCWPAEPLSEPGEERALTLLAGEHYDRVVLAIPAPACPDLVQDLVRTRGAWRQLVEGIPTVATQALQVWTEQDLKGLGWHEGSTVLTGFDPELDSWADMTELLWTESWGDAVRGVHYFCACLPEEQDDEATLALQARWFDEQLPALWPDWNGQQLSGYARNNRTGSSRYIQSHEGTIQYRLAPGDSRFENLVLAGDWTRTSVNAGSAEAAVESGLLAARALGAEVDIA